MLEHDVSPCAGQERKRLLFLVAGFGLASSGLWWLRPGGIGPIVLGVLCLIALAGTVAYPIIGRDVYVMFGLMAYTVGRAVSWPSIVVMYGVAIVLGGSLLRLGGMDMLRRSFSACKRRETMFEAAPRTDKESFGRQS